MISKDHKFMFARTYLPRLRTSWLSRSDSEVLWHSKLTFKLIMFRLSYRRVGFTGVFIHISLCALLIEIFKKNLLCFFNVIF